MRVLVTYASAGAGHKRVAEAIFDYLKINRSDLKLELLDIIPSATGFFRFSYGKGYTFLVHYLPWLWGFFFWMTESRFTRWFSRKSSVISNYFSCRKFKQFLESKNFDYIISTHFLNSELAANLKLKNKISGKLITVITDFGVHPFWVSKGTDLYIVASWATKDKLLAMGVEEPRIQDSGIPFSSSFVKSSNREQLASKLSVEGKKFTVLLMTGSFGLGPLEQIAANICIDVQVLLVCANNQTMFNRLKKKNLKNVKVFGFVNNIQELMNVSDIMITKPGGSSIVELLNMDLFPIFISAIPGQEKENIKVLDSCCDVGYAPKSIKEIKERVIDLKNNPHKLVGLKKNLLQLRKSFACRDLANVIR